MIVKPVKFQTSFQIGVGLLFFVWWGYSKWSRKKKSRALNKRDIPNLRLHKKWKKSVFCHYLANFVFFVSIVLENLSREEYRKRQIDRKIKEENTLKKTCCKLVSRLWQRAGWTNPTLQDIRKREVNVDKNI